MSYRRCSVGIVLGMLAILIGMAPILFAAPAGQHTHDPQVAKDANEGGEDGLKGFDDIEVGQPLVVEGIIKRDDFILREITVFTNCNTRYQGGLEGFDDLAEDQGVEVKAGKLSSGGLIAFEVKQKGEPRHPGFRDFRTVARLNMDKHITNFTYGLTDNCTIREGNLYAFFSGPFDRSEIEESLTEDDGFAVGQEDNVTKYTTTRDYGEGVPPLTAGFLDDYTLLMSYAPAFASLVAAAKGTGPNVPSSDPLGKLLADGDMGWLYVALRIPEKIKAQLQKRTVTEPLSHVQAVSLSVGFTDENLMTLAYQADTIANAETIAEKFQGLAKPDDERTRDERTLAIALSNLLKLWNPDIELYDALNTFLRMAQVIIDGESLRLLKIEEGSILTNSGPDARRIRKQVYVLSPGMSISDLLKQFGISTGLKE